MLLSLVFGLFGGFVIDLVLMRLPGAEGEAFSFAGELFVWMPVMVGVYPACFACVVAFWPLVRQLRQVTGSDFTTALLLQNVVLRRKDDELTDQQSVLAVKYASIMANYTLFQGLSFLLLYIALAVAQLPSLLSDSGAPFASLSFWMIVALAPLMIRQGKRAQRYAREHRNVFEDARCRMKASWRHPDSENNQVWTMLPIWCAPGLKHDPGEPGQPGPKPNAGDERRPVVDYDHERHTTTAG